LVRIGAIEINCHISDQTYHVLLGRTSRQNC